MQKCSSSSKPVDGCSALIASTMASHDAGLRQFSADESNTNDVSIRLQVKRLTQALDRGTCKLIRLLPEFDRQQAWAPDGQRSCVAWLNAFCGMSLSAAHDRCRVAYALELLPLISRLFMLGELSWSKVRALTRIATPENENELASQALLMSASGIERMAREYRNIETLGDLKAENEKANQLHKDRRVHYSFDHRGMVSIHASLPPLEGAAVLKSMARAEDELFADSLETIEEHELTTTHYCVPEENPARRSATQLRADALCLMAKKHLAAESLDIKTADRYQVVVHVDANTLKHSFGAGAQSSSLCHIENGPSIAASTARRLADDCSVIPIYMRQGEPLSIGRKSRIWNSAISRAITTRDQHCQFPGCSSARHTHIHHLRHWANGGETSVENGVLLCGFHHRLVHEENYRVEKAPVDVNGNCLKREINVDKECGGTITLSARRPRFLVRRPDGSEV